MEAHDAGRATQQRPTLAARLEGRIQQRAHMAVRPTGCLAGLAALATLAALAAPAALATLAAPAALAALAAPAAQCAKARGLRAAQPRALRRVECGGHLVRRDIGEI